MEQEVHIFELRVDLQLFGAAVYLNEIRLLFQRVVQALHRFLLSLSLVLYLLVRALERLVVVRKTSALVSFLRSRWLLNRVLQSRRGANHLALQKVNLRLNLLLLLFNLLAGLVLKRLLILSVWAGIRLLDFVPV